MNEFLETRSLTLEREWFEQAELLAGDAFYLLDTDKFRNNVTSFRSAVSKHYSNVKLAYSYKTNYIPELVRIAHEMGMCSEVVSRTELDLALRLGIPGEQIIFNGPLKTEDDLRSGIVHNVLINVDSISELQRLSTIIQQTPQTEIDIGLRVGFDLATGLPTRFGICVDNGDLDVACSMLKNMPQINIAGFHCHFSVSTRDSDSYRFRIRRLLELAENYDLQHSIKFLDVGGGFAGELSKQMEAMLGRQYPSYSEYGEALGNEMAIVYGKNQGPELILEPGMGLVADVLKFACKVHTLKRTARGNIAIASGSIFNIKPFLHTKNIPFQRISTPGAEHHEQLCTDVTGYTCMEIDVLYENYGAPLAEGDFLLFENCGAYTCVLLPPFIRFAPPVLSFSNSDQQPVLVARSVSVDDVLKRYEVSQ